jgi:hypothetical protein
VIAVAGDALLLDEPGSVPSNPVGDRVRLPQVSTRGQVRRAGGVDSDSTDRHSAALRVSADGEPAVRPAGWSGSAHRVFAGTLGAPTERADREQWGGHLQGPPLVG